MNKCNEIWPYPNTGIVSKIFKCVGAIICGIFSIGFIIILILIISTSLSILSYPGVEARNPTYQEMVEFIQNDNTDLGVYDFDNYVCRDFAEDLIVGARTKGIHAGYVSLDLSAFDYPYMHAVVCFNTTDEGLYFVDPQSDFMFNESKMDFIYGYDGSKACYRIDW